MIRAFILLSMVLFPLFSISQTHKEFQKEHTKIYPPEKLKTVLSKANNQFGLDFFKATDFEGKNGFISPFSASSVLALTYMGASKKTAKQMQDVLHLEGKQKDIAGEYNKLFSLMNHPFYTKNPEFQLNVANSIWVAKDFKLLDSYVNTCNDDFKTEAATVDFNQVDSTLNVINGWVEDHTNNKIKKLLTPRHVDGETKLVLVNALYFKAQWKKQFKVNRTDTLSFFTPEKEVKTAFMHKIETMNYAEDDDFQYVTLPYKSGSNMLVALPKDKSKFDSLRTAFDITKLEQMMANKNNSLVDLYFPKYKIESQIDMNKILSGLGMPIAFSSSANFSGMTGDKSLRIGAVVQKTFIEVDEKGTEAAAATAVVMKRATSFRPGKDKVIFKADHPFLFFIVENVTDNILFIGQLADPTQN